MSKNTSRNIWGSGFKDMDNLVKDNPLSEELCDQLEQRWKKAKPVWKKKEVTTAGTAGHWRTLGGSEIIESKPVWGNSPPPDFQIGRSPSRNHIFSSNFSDRFELVIVTGSLFSVLYSIEESQKVRYRI